MTQQHTPLRPAFTALAAVLALSSTAAFAQSADQAADPSAPAIAAPPAPSVSATAPVAVQSSDSAPAIEAPAPSTSDASASVADTPTPAPVAAPAAAMATQSTPVIQQPDAVSAAPRASRTATTERTVTHSASATTTARSDTPAPAPVATPAPQPVLTPAAPPAPIAAAKTSSTTTTTQSGADETLPIAGAVALGLIAIGGGAYAFSRRRRDDEDETLLVAEPTERTLVVPAETPTLAAATEAATAIPATPAVAHREDDADEVMALPNGFDLSRFGRHTRAAYRGPSPDNPSVSLRNRLRHASFFDQREREAAADHGVPVPATPIAARTAAKPDAIADNDQIVVRPGARRKSGFFGTAFSR